VSYVRVREGRIEYDVRDARPPFRLDKDPALGGMRPKRKRRRARKELRPELERYRLYTEDELGEFPPVEWRIRDYLAAGELTIFYGKGDTYKSFVALDWSCWLAARGLLVVYVVAEGASGIRARVAAWKKHHQVAKLPNLRFMPSNVSLHDPASVGSFLEAMREQLGAKSPDLVVVDTLARNFVGGNESSPQDMGLFVDGVERIRREFACAVLVIHHATKEGGSERGTESLRNASFAMFEFERVNQNRVAKVKCDRMKDAEQPATVWVRPLKIDLPDIGEDVSSLVADWPYTSSDSRPAEDDTGRESGASLSRREQRLLAAVSGANEGVKPAQLAKALKISGRTASRIANDLVKRGFLSAEGKTRDRAFTLTAAGREAVE
jgi:predicted transcriptional regulator